MKVYKVNVFHFLCQYSERSHCMFTYTNCQNVHLLQFNVYIYIHDCVSENHKFTFANILRNSYHFEHIHSEKTSLTLPCMFSRTILT